MEIEWVTAPFLLPARRDPGKIFSLNRMKTLILVGLATTLTSNLFGQGQVSFNNRDLAATPNPVSSPIYSGVVGGTLLAGSGFRAALLGGTTDAIPAHIPTSRTNDSSSLVSGGTLLTLSSPTSVSTWASFRTGTLAGFVAVGSDNLRDSQLPFGSIGQFQVVAWNGGYRAWNEAFAAWQAGTPGVLIGASNPLILPVSLSPTDLDVPTLQGMESFAIVAAPEPNSGILFGLGFAVWASLTWLRLLGPAATFGLGDTKFK
jgi:hypothetical protein